MNVIVSKLTIKLGSTYIFYGLIKPIPFNDYFLSSNQHKAISYSIILS